MSELSVSSGPLDPSALPDPLVAFHATDPVAAAAIAVSGFTPSSSLRALGPGVYLCRDASTAAAWRASGHMNVTGPVDVSVLSVVVPAGLRAARLVKQPTAWGSFRALGDARGTLVERYSSDAEASRVGMIELNARLVDRFASDEDLDVVEVLIAGDHDDSYLRTSQIVVRPRAAHLLCVERVDVLATSPRW